MARLHHLAGFLVLTAGCAAAPPPPRSAPLAADLEAWVAAGSSAGAPARASSLSQTARAEDDAPRMGVAHHRIAPPPSLPPRPTGRARVDVSFQGADMVSAFQFLADAGRFNLVMQDGLTGKVSATLKGVDPYDALLSLAEANGATVTYDRQIVVVSKR
ncbi:MAG: hypothetical protein QM820_61540 [Minicystis sp.]